MAKDPEVQTPRRKLKRMMPVVLLLGCALYAARTWWNVTHIHGMIMALQPVGNGRAIVCMRANAEYGQKPRSWIGLYDTRRDTWIWAEQLTALVDLSGPSDRTPALRIHEGRAIVREGRSDDAKGEVLVSSYSLEDGKRQWQTTLEAVSQSRLVDLVAAGGAVLVATGSRGKVTALELASGRPRWSAELDWRFQNPRVVAEGSTLVVDDEDGSAAIDLKSGSTRRLSVGCVDKDRFVRLEPSMEELRVVEEGIPDKSRRAVADVRLPDAWQLPRVTSCVRYADRFVFFITKHDDRETGMITIAEGSSEVRFRALGIAASGIGLGRSIVGSPLANDAGAPRIMLLQAGDSLVELDMAEGVIRRSTPINALPSDRFFYDGAGTYAILRDERALTIAWIDGADGHISAAACADRNVEPPLPFHLRGEELWLHSGRWIAGLPQLSVLNTRTLAPTGPNTLHVRDCGEEIRLRWKM